VSLLLESNNQNIFRARCEKLNHFFEIGIILITVLSAQELVYASVLALEPTPQITINDMEFLFKILTLPIIIIVLFWLIKEVFPVPSQRILGWQLPRWFYLRRWMKEFCWFSLTLFISLEIIAFVAFGFPKSSKLVYQPLTIALALVGFFLTLFVTYNYRKCEIETTNEQKARERFIKNTVIEHAVVWLITVVIFLFVF
jgi:hypothetical protein